MLRHLNYVKLIHNYAKIIWIRVFPVWSSTRLLFIMVFHPVFIMLHKSFKLAFDYTLSQCESREHNQKSILVWLMSDLTMLRDGEAYQTECDRHDAPGSPVIHLYIWSVLVPVCQLKKNRTQKVNTQHAATSLHLSSLSTNIGDWQLCEVCSICAKLCHTRAHTHTQLFFVS